MFTVYDYSVLPCRSYEFGTLSDAVGFVIELGLPDGVASITMPPSANA